MRRKADPRERSGFASTLLVLAVMICVGVLGMLCARMLLDARRYSQRTIADTQLEWLIVASDHWLAAGGELQNDQPETLVLSSNDDVTLLKVQLERDGDEVNGVATIERGGTTLATRRFTLTKNTFTEPETAE